MATGQINRGISEQRFTRKNKTPFSQGTNMNSSIPLGGRGSIGNGEIRNPFENKNLGINNSNRMSSPSSGFNRRPGMSAPSGFNKRMNYNSINSNNSFNNMQKSDLNINLNISEILKFLGTHILRGLIYSIVFLIIMSIFY